jgi:hypothetical protein
MPTYNCGMGDPLDILVEECSEVVQAAMKWRRFSGSGTDHNPATGLSAREQLVQEIGDIFAAVDVLVSSGTLSITNKEIADARLRKLEKLQENFGFQLVDRP